MDSLVVGTFVALDGVMQGPDGPDEDRRGGFTPRRLVSRVLGRRYEGSIAKWTAQGDALLLGRMTLQDLRGALAARPQRRSGRSHAQSRGHQPVPSRRRHPVRLVRGGRARRGRGAVDRREGAPMSDALQSALDAEA
jgi:hypothetical protein